MNLFNHGDCAETSAESAHFEAATYWKRTFSAAIFALYSFISVFEQNTIHLASPQGCIGLDFHAVMGNPARLLESGLKASTCPHIARSEFVVEKRAEKRKENLRKTPFLFLSPQKKFRMELSVVLAAGLRSGPIGSTVYSIVSLALCFLC